MNPTTFAVLALSFVASLGVGCASSPPGSAPKAPPPAKTSEAGVAQVVSAMRPDLAACFEQGRRYDPALHGGFVAEVHVGSGGSVESVDAQDVEGLNRAVIGCMTKRMQSARFPAPGDKGATVRIPLRFEA
jgi:hypothetical protein